MTTAKKMLFLLGYNLKIFSWCWGTGEQKLGRGEIFLGGGWGGINEQIFGWWRASPLPPSL